MSYSFVGPDGLTYNLSKFRHTDIIEFHKWVQYKSYFDFQSLKDRVPADLFAEQSKSLLVECSKKTKQQVSDEAEGWQASIEGTSYLIYLSLRPQSSEHYRASVANIVTDDNVSEINGLLTVLNSTIRPDVKKKNQAAPLSHSTPAHSTGSVSVSA